MSSRVHGWTPASFIAADRPAGGVEGREEGDHRRLRRRQRAEPEGRLGDDRQGPLAADDERDEPVAGDVLDRPPAEPDDRAVGGHDLQPDDRVAGHAVLHAAQPAGVRAQVPPDRAGLVARRVGRVEEALGLDRLLEVDVDHPRLADDDEVLAVDLEDPVHPGEGDRQAAGDARRSAAQPGPGAPRDDRHPVLGGQPDQLGDLGGLRRQGHGDRSGRLEVGGLVATIASRGRPRRSAGAGRAGAPGRRRGTPRSDPGSVTPAG